MNISQWSKSEILQLPDHAFGQKFMISTYIGLSGMAPTTTKTEYSLPERSIVWSAFCYGTQANAYAYKLGMRLCPNAMNPTGNWAQLDRLFRTSVTPLQSYDFWFPSPANWQLTGLRYYVESQGQQLALLMGSYSGSGTGEVHCGIIVSAVPSEVPDWILK